MAKENTTEFRKLVNKYLNGTASTEEQKAIEKYYALFSAAPEMSDLLEDAQIDGLDIRIREAISKRIQQRETPFYKRKYVRFAAMIAVTAGAAWALVFNTIQTTKNTALSPVTVARAEPTTPANRFITLPDGSSVVLHGDSHLEYDAGFKNGKREVTLTGEAYFDVAHNPESPFIIYSGKVKTTVLGTSFNIKAWPGQKDITVSVTRGKVKVEDEEQLIAVLTEDKQIVYNTETLTAAKEETLNTADAIVWVQADMTFDEIPLGILAEQIGIRYGIQVTFENQGLKQCPITGRFSGTETLEEVLRILTATSNTRYTLTGQEVLITGEKCF